MKKTHIMIISFAFLFVLGSVMVLASHGANRVPTDGGDANNWGHILNTCLDNVLDAGCGLDTDVVVSADITDATITSADIGVDVIDDVDVFDDGLDATSLADTLDLTAAAEDFAFTVDAANNLLVTGVQSTDVTLAANRMALSGVGLVAEGATLDGSETTITIADPTVDNTFTLGATGQLTSTGDLGWTMVASAGAQSCSVTCAAQAGSPGCVFGLDDVDDAGATLDENLVACGTALSAVAQDQCLCAG